MEDVGLAVRVGSHRGRLGGLALAQERRDRRRRGVAVEREDGVVGHGLVDGAQEDVEVGRVAEVDRGVGAQIERLLILCHRA